MTTTENAPGDSELVDYLTAVGRGSVRLDQGPRLPLAPGHARVRVAYVGICHSDTALVREGQGSFPARLGHEVSGIISESDDPELPEGARVAAYISDGYATEVQVPSDRIVPLHSGCSLADAALSEPLACAIGGVEMLDLASTPRVVLVGAGFMGLLALRLMACRGLPVTVIEPRKRTRDLAVRWGAESVLAPDEVPESMIANNSLVVEATGSAAGLELASGLVEIAGTLGILGYHQSGKGLRSVDMESWNYRALRVLSLHHRNPADVMRWMDRAQRLSANRIVVPSELVDRHVPLTELPELFMNGEEGDTIKSLLDLTSENA
ncbi:alcohol dehydrogenase catalytic domain-containing protein [Sinomonas terrae]|uniref:Alcohol dehydrogenase catalytic domain-containing protein n=1 Tax=Sinomonas terrae TaxID=2908838 RepID=A0ABS9U480_9MICC|nr:alcohol dehydrogenase catalytic domain-containing protein [Sinomonas terrae]MCH6471494.1 alcohol dehydrogenase catalytic domain-containing protein [Sinomonas terrae]